VVWEMALFTCCLLLLHFLFPYQHYLFRFRASSSSFFSFLVFPLVARQECTYLHAEGYSGGALKHGPFALIEGPDGKNGATPIILFVLDDEFSAQMRCCAEEVKARGAEVFVHMCMGAAHFRSGEEMHYCTLHACLLAWSWVQS